MNIKKGTEVEKMVEAALNSLEGISRATANPYLFTRIKAGLANNRETTWDKIAVVISRPSVLVSGLCLLIAINVVVIITHTSSNRNAVAEQLSAQQPDEYNTAIATIYDIENIEP